MSTNVSVGICLGYKCIHCYHHIHVVIIVCDYMYTYIVNKCINLTIENIIVFKYQFHTVISLPVLSMEFPSASHS